MAYMPKATFLALCLLASAVADDAKAAAATAPASKDKDTVQAVMDLLKGKSAAEVSSLISSLSTSKAPAAAPKAAPATPAPAAVVTAAPAVVATPAPGPPTSLGLHRDAAPPAAPITPAPAPPVAPPPAPTVAAQAVPASGTATPAPAPVVASQAVPAVGVVTPEKVAKAAPPAAPPAPIPAAVAKKAPAAAVANPAAPAAQAPQAAKTTVATALPGKGKGKVKTSTASKDAKAQKTAVVAAAGAVSASPKAVVKSATTPPTQAKQALQKMLDKASPDQVKKLKEKVASRSGVTSPTPAPMNGDDYYYKYTDAADAAASDDFAESGDIPDSAEYGSYDRNDDVFVPGGGESDSFGTDSYVDAQFERLRRKEDEIMKSGAKDEFEYDSMQKPVSSIAKGIVDGTLEGRQGKSSFSLLQYLVVGLVVCALGLWYMQRQAAASAWLKRNLHKELGAVSIPGMGPYDAGATQGLLGKKADMGDELDDLGLPTSSNINYGSSCYGSSKYGL